MELNNTQIKSCIVAVHSKCNHATSERKNATANATLNATLDILALADKVLEQNKRNSRSNLSATDALHPSFSRATTTIGKISSGKEYLRKLIREISFIEKETDSSFLEIFTQEVFSKYGNELERLNFSIVCYEDILHNIRGN